MQEINDLEIVILIHVISEVNLIAFLKDAKISRSSVLVLKTIFSPYINYAFPSPSEQCNIWHCVASLFILRVLTELSHFLKAWGKKKKKNFHRSLIHELRASFPHMQHQISLLPVSEFCKGCIALRAY